MQTAAFGPLIVFIAQQHNKLSPKQQLQLREIFDSGER